MYFVEGWSEVIHFSFFFGDVTEYSLQPTDGLVFPNPEEAWSPHSRFVLNLKIYIDVIYKKLNLWQGNPCRPLRSGSSWKIKPSNGICKNVWWISSDDQRWGLGSLEHTCPSLNEVRNLPSNFITLVSLAVSFPWCDHQVMDFERFLFRPTPLGKLNFQV